MTVSNSYLIDEIRFDSFQIDQLQTEKRFVSPMPTNIKNENSWTTWTCHMLSFGGRFIFLFVNADFIKHAVKKASARNMIIPFIEAAFFSGPHV